MMATMMPDPTYRAKEMLGMQVVSDAEAEAERLLALSTSCLSLKEQKAQKEQARSDQKYNRLAVEDNEEAQRQAERRFRQQYEALRNEDAMLRAWADNEDWQDKMYRTRVEQAARSRERQNLRNREDTAAKHRLDRWRLLRDQYMHQMQNESDKDKQARRLRDDVWQSDESARQEMLRMQRDRAATARAAVLDEMRQRRDFLFDETAHQFRQHVAEGKAAALEMKRLNMENAAKLSTANERRRQEEQAYWRTHIDKARADKERREEATEARRAQEAHRRKQVMAAEAREEQNQHQALSTARKRMLAEAKLRAARKKEAREQQRAVNEQQRAKRERDQLNERLRRLADANQRCTEHVKLRHAVLDATPRKFRGERLVSPQSSPRSSSARASKPRSASAGRGPPSPDSVMIH